MMIEKDPETKIVVGESGQEYESVRVPDEHMGTRDKLLIPKDGEQPPTIDPHEES